MSDASSAPRPAPKQLTHEEARLPLRALFAKYEHLEVAFPERAHGMITALFPHDYPQPDVLPEGWGKLWTVGELESLYGPGVTLQQVLDDFGSPPPPEPAWGPQPSKPEAMRDELVNAGPETHDDTRIVAARRLVGDERLTTWEAEFLPSVLDQYDRRGTLSPKQWKSLERLLARIEEHA